MTRAKTGNAGKKEKQKDGEGQAAGQAHIEDYPEYLPEGYKTEKVAPVQPEAETEKEQENVIKTGPGAEDGSREGDSGQQASFAEGDAAEENAVEGTAKEAAVLEGMSPPGPEWVNAAEPSRAELAAEIRQLAVHIADTVTENAFHGDPVGMGQLETAKEDSGRLAELIGGLIETIKKEAYQE